MLVLWVAAPMANAIPLAALSAILLHVAWNMGEWREFTRLSTYTPSDRLILVVTFLLTVIFDLTVAVEAGLVLAALCALSIPSFLPERVTQNWPIHPINLGLDLAGGSRVLGREPAGAQQGEQHDQEGADEMGSGAHAACHAFQYGSPSHRHA